MLMLILPQTNLNMVDMKNNLTLSLPQYDLATFLLEFLVYHYIYVMKSCFMPKLDKNFFQKFM